MTGLFAPGRTRRTRDRPAQRAPFHRHGDRPHFGAPSWFRKAQGDSGRRAGVDLSCSRGNRLSHRADGRSASARQLRVSRGRSSRFRLGAGCPALLFSCARSLTSTTEEGSAVSTMHWHEVEIKAAYATK